MICIIPQGELSICRIEKSKVFQNWSKTYRIRPLKVSLALPSSSCSEIIKVYNFKQRAQSRKGILVNKILPVQFVHSDIEKLALNYSFISVHSKLIFSFLQLCSL